MAQMIRAILFAKATAATLIGLRAIILPSQVSAKPGLRWLQRMTDMAPITSRRRIDRSPILVIRPRRALPPLEFWRGTRPSHAEKSRADRKLPASGTPARIIGMHLDQAGPNRLTG